MLLAADRPSVGPLVPNAGQSSVSPAAAVSVPKLEEDAYTRQLHLKQFGQRVKADVLEIGRLLWEGYKAGDWSVLRYESFKAYIEELELPFSYSWTTQLMRIYGELIEGKGLAPAVVEEIGVTKAAMLLPAARHGKLTEELIEAAKMAPANELAEDLGYHRPQRDEQYSIDCPRCGVQITGARFVSAKATETLNRKWLVSKLEEEPLDTSIIEILTEHSWVKTVPHE